MNTELRRKVQDAADANRESRNILGSVGAVLVVLGTGYVEWVASRGWLAVGIGALFVVLALDAHRLLRRLQREGGAR